LSDTLKKEPEWVWIVLLAMFTGARLTEICQLKPNDINIIDRTISIQETADEETSLKNLNSTRIIPICDFIVECGFLMYVFNQTQDLAGTDKVVWGWEKTKLVEKYGWGRYFGKRFNEYNRTHITKEELKSFHSFRHNVITHLNKYHPELHIVSKRFVGHAPEGVNLSNYTHDEWDEKMRQVANAVFYNDNSYALNHLRHKLVDYFGYYA
jgi:integrase